MTDPTVVLVSVGADSAVLIDEIERKGLRVVSCPFAEAEEAIERERPLLVVLHGSRGAVELSTMLEDATDPPQVAVVATRAELGTLMGLNRDIVVSLLATELTEKTVAVRLEAVVRQRAKALGLTLNLAARRMSLGPRPNLSRPAPRPDAEPKSQNLVLEAPTPDVLGPKFKAPPPPALDAPAPSSKGLGPAPSAASRAMPAPASQHRPPQSRAMVPPPDDARPPPRGPRVSSGTAIGLPAPGRPDPGRPEPGRPDPSRPDPSRPEPAAPPRRPPSREMTPSPPVPEAESILSASLLLSDIPLPGTAQDRTPPGAPPSRAGAPAHAPPPRPAPPRPAPGQPLAEPSSSAYESDAPTAVISLTPSVIESLTPHEAGEGTRPVAPAPPPVPRFEPSELLSESGFDASVGPDLRAVLSFDRGPANAQVAKPSVAEPELPSAPLLPRVHEAGVEGGSADVLDQLPGSPAPGEAAPRAAAPHAAEAAAPPLRSAFDDDDELALPLLRPSRPPDLSGEDFSSGMLTEVTMPAIPGSLAAEALAEARLRSEPNHPIPEPPADMPDPEEDRATVTGAAPSALAGFGLSSGLGSSGAASPPAPSGISPRSVSSRPLLSPVRPTSEPPRKSGRGGLIAACAVVAALGGAGAYVKWGVPKPARPSVRHEPAAAVAPANPVPTSPSVASTAPSAEPPDLGDPDAPTAPAEASATPPSDTPTQAADAADTATPPTDPVEPTEPAPPTEAPEAAPVDTAAAPAPAGSNTTEPAVLLDNPFATPDANLPGCDQLVPAGRPATPDPVTEASVHWAAARKSIVKGDIEAASRSMCLAVALNPQSPAVEGLARLYTLSHSPTQALIWVERAIQLAPTNRELLSLRGDAKSQLGRQDEATLDWLEAMGIAPDETKRRGAQAAEYANIGRTERGRSDLAKAEQFFRRALGFEETNLVALTGIAELLLARKLYDQAGTFAVKALAVFEPVPEAYVVLGDVALAKNDPARARASYERALAIRPDFWLAKTRLRDLPK